MANIIQRASNAVQAVFQPKRSVLMGSAFASNIQIGVAATYPTYDAAWNIRAYQDNATVFTIVEAMVRKFAFVPTYVYKVKATSAQQKYQQAMSSKSTQLTAIKMRDLKKKAYGDDVVENTPLSLLLTKPNPTMAQDTYDMLFYGYRKLTGNAFEWLNRGNDEIEGPARYKLPILERYVLPSHLVTINVDREYLFGQVKSYTFWDNGQKIILHPEDVLHWRGSNFNYDAFTFNHMYGVSPLTAGGKLITQNEAITDASVSMYQNGGARGVLYNESFNNLDPKQKQSMDDAIDTKINNRHMKSAAAALPGKWGWLQLGLSSVDMGLVDATDKNFIGICNLFGWNSQSFLPGGTFNNVEQARKDNITNTILPDVASLTAERNRVYLQAFGLSPDQFCIEADVSDLAELSEDMVAKTTMVMATWPLTPNEMRKELGYDPMPDADMDNVYIPSTLTLLEDAALPGASLGGGFGDPAGNDAPGATGGNNSANGGGKVPPGKKNVRRQEVDDAWNSI